MRIKHAIVVVAVAAVCGAALGKEPLEVSESDIGTKTVILGELGLPIGRAVKIHGTKKTIGATPYAFVVDEINGKKVEPEAGKKFIFVRTPSIRKWPDDTKATMLGREQGIIRYLTIDDGNFDDNDPRFKPRQTIFLEFVPEKVLEPKGLELDVR